MKKLLIMLMFLPLFGTSQMAMEYVNEVDLHIKKKKTSTHSDGLYISNGTALMIGGAMFLGAAVLVGSETEWTYGKEAPWHSNNNVQPKPYTDKPIYKQPQKWLPGLTGVGLLVAGVSINLGNKH
jgi:hypothetical protein